MVCCIGPSTRHRTICETSSPLHTSRDLDGQVLDMIIGGLRMVGIVRPIHKPEEFEHSCVVHLRCSTLRVESAIDSES